MPNTLTNLAADIYTAKDIVGRNLAGLMASVTINGGSERAAKGDTVRSHFTRAQTVETTYAPSMTIPEGTNQVVDSKTLTLNSFASIKIPYEGEEKMHLNAGAGFETVYGDQIKQAFNSIANKIELDLWSEVYKNSSRAYGTAGTTPFASNFNELPQLRKILVDNGCPFDGNMSAVMDTTAGANLRSLATLQKANEAGGTELLRQGTLLDIQGFFLKESAAITLHTKGTGASATTDAAGYAVGATTITLAAIGTGTILAGDIATFAGDTNKYPVVTGDTNVANAGTIVLAAPGLRVAITTAATAITVGANYTPNVALHRSAVELAIRPVGLGKGGDVAADVMTVHDEWSGLSFEVALYLGYMKNMIDVRCLYQPKVWKPEFVATLLG